MNILQELKVKDSRLDYLDFIEDRQLAEHITTTTGFSIEAALGATSSLDWLGDR